MGRTTECPSCFKKLTVPQAPTDSGTKLIITASLADSRRASIADAPVPVPQRVAEVASKGPLIYILLALLTILVAVILLLSLENNGWGPSGGPSNPLQLWTDQTHELKLFDTPVVGRLNKWDFALTSASWRDTTLILQQDEGEPEALSLRITFPLQAGELVPGKNFRFGPNSPSSGTSLRIVWKNERGNEESQTVRSEWILWIEFDEVSQTTVGGRIHVCVLDADRSWMAGRFSAANRTTIR